MAQQKWTTADIGDQTGRVAIVTGGNSGIGYETVKALAHKGAIVIMASRNMDKAGQAADEIRATHPSGSVEVVQLDLNDLESVKEFAGAIMRRFERLDLLINNAGIMVPPYGKTKQGFETQFGVNHLGHFALTGLLLDMLLKTADSRIVNVSSLAHRFGQIHFDDLNWESDYKPGGAYGQSKLANLLFTYELQRRFKVADRDVVVAAAHPGWTETNLQAHAGRMRFFNRFFAQEPPMGALPTLRAAVGEDVLSGDYFGPAGWMEMSGSPKRVKSNKQSHDHGVARKLWDISERLTGVNYHFSRGDRPLAAS